MKFIKIAYIISILIFSQYLFAQESEPLPLDKAFEFSAMVKDEQTIVVKWHIAPEHLLYKDKLKFVLANPKIAKLSDPLFPIATTKQDINLGQYQVYSNDIQIAIPVMVKQHAKIIDLKVTYQGCAVSGYCYPPTTKEVSLNMKDNFGKYIEGKIVPTPIETNEEDNMINNLLENGKIITIIVSFFGFGLLLSFTPCVLPMIPILSGIIIGHRRKLTTHKAFYLSSAYVLSMATTYAIAGILVGYLGSTLQVLFQQPWILIASSFIFVVLAFSMFGFYEIQLPTELQNKLNNVTSKITGGSYLSVAIMGSLATLILSPCVTPALVGALAYIAKTGNALLGGLSLFSLGLGMGAPLIAIGTAHGNFLPKAGKWMNAVKNFFGVILLAMAIWILNRILPNHLIMFLWGCLLIITSMYVGFFESTNKKTHYKHFRRGLGIIMLIYGILLAVGAGFGNQNPIKPLENLSTVQHEASCEKLSFTTIKTLDDFKTALAEAKSEHKNILLDFYADWCIACQNMQNDIFPNHYIAPLLKNFILLQANVTRNDQLDIELQKYFKVIAPPTILFFDPNGNEIKNHRIIGEIGVNKFMWHLQEILK